MTEAVEKIEALLRLMPDNGNLLRSLIRTLLSKQREEMVKILEEKQKLHSHDSIPCYVTDPDCILCQRNQPLTDAIQAIKE